MKIREGKGGWALLLFQEGKGEASQTKKEPSAYVNDGKVGGYGFKGRDL